MLHADHSRVDRRRGASTLLDAALVRLDPAPIARCDVKRDGGVGMDVEDRVRMQVAVRAGLAMLGVVEGHEPGARDHAERVLLGVLRVRFGEVRREREARQRVEVAP